MSLSPTFLDELRARTSLSALVGKTTKLQKAGREMRGCCPFHNEKTPSFYVNDDKGFYHCFGCSAHGDAIKWLTDQRGLPFIEAVKELAQAAGMEMPAQDRQSAAKAERVKGLHEASEDAAAWFAEQLYGLPGAEARALLERRGISAETARTFGMGFAPDSRGRLKAALKDYGDPMLVEAGLLIQVEGKEPYDRFRGRLMIPIRDARGRTIAFGGRILDQGEPKYLNSPDTPLFDKGRTLYNVDRAAPAARRANRLLVVEGYMDVIALAQAGIGECVAPLGTALTEAQLERLWRMVDVPVLCFDGDAAGQKAALRAAHRALPMLVPGKSLSFVTLPQGQDPDDLVKAGGPAAMEKRISQRQSMADLLWRSELGGMDGAGPDQRAAFEERIKNLALTIQHEGVRRAYQDDFRKRFKALFSWNKTNFEAVREAAREANRQEGRGLEFVFHRAVLLGLMRHPSVVGKKLELIVRLPFVDRYIRRWRKRLLDYLSENPAATEDMIDRILDGTDVSPIERRCYTKDLAYTFFQKNANREVAVRDLEQVIDVMHDEYETKLAFRLAHEVFTKEMSAEAFEFQTACQRDAAAAERQLHDWLELAREAA